MSLFIMLAKNLINNSIISASGADTASTALSLMDDFRVTHIPVVNDAEFLGLISEPDIFECNDFETPLNTLDTCLKNHYVFEYQHIYDILRLASDMKLTLIPVLDTNSKYLGSITLLDIIIHFSGMLSVNNEGGIIVLELSYNDYSLSEISQIIESNNAKVISLFITSWPDSTKIEVTIKLNTTNIEPVVQTFNRYKYFVKASFNEKTDYNDLKDRYDSLMKYLDV